MQHAFWCISLLHDHDVKFPYETFFGGRKRPTTNFFSFSKLFECGAHGIQLQRQWNNICHFKRVGVNANKFEKKNIHFNSDVFAALAVRPIFINVTLPFGFYANSCDPRRKSIGFVVRIVYTTKHCEFKLIGYKISGELTKPGRFLTGSFVHHFPYIKIHAGFRGLGE